MVVDVRKSLLANLKIVSTWENTCSVEYDDSSNKEILQILHLPAEETFCVELTAQTDEVNVTIRVPELFNVHVAGEELNLEMKNKFHGDFSVNSTSGQVFIDKIRGADVRIAAGASSVSIRKTIEGNTMLIQSDSLGANMIHGDELSIFCKRNVDVGALYVKESFIEAAGAVDIGLLQGSAAVSEVGRTQHQHQRNGEPHPNIANNQSLNVSLQVTAGGGSLRMRGIDGSFQALAKKGDISLQINTIKSRDGAGSTAVALEGHLTAEVDPEVNEVDLSSSKPGSDVGGV